MTSLQKKVTTMTMKGGNTDTIYAQGRRQFVKSLQRQHPDVVRHVTRYGRDHHHVDYGPFQDNALVKAPGQRRQSLGPEYGMRLVKRPVERPVEKAPRRSRRTA